MTLERQAVLDIEFFAGDLSTAAGLVIDHALRRMGGYICVCSAHGLMTSRVDPAILQAHQQARAVFPDGAPVAWLERRAGAATAQRIAGPDLMPLVIDFGRVDGLRHFFFGSTEAVLSALCERLTARFPGAQVAGVYAPPLIDFAAEDGIAEIRASCPDIVWCGLGHPKQELWMQAHAASLAPSLLIGVGAAFEFNAGTKLRAPAWMQRNGLEWAHRLAREPRRLVGRYVAVNTRFLVTVAKEGLWKRRQPTSHEGAA
jgi:N-acetylglucosaminyldiphosphoundecaprenol N-acetyl-beta-D-mannosaminyltransferase